MARALTTGSTASPTNPVLDLWTLGWQLYPTGISYDPGNVRTWGLVDVSAVAWEVFDMTSGSPVSVAAGTLNVAGADHLGTGHYAATWTATGNAGLHRIVWSVTFADATTGTFQNDFDVLAAGLALKGPAYCLLSDLRTEGFTTAQLSDARALSLIRTCSLLLERWTSRFFEPRYKTVNVDGDKGPTLWLNDPIISFDSVSIDTELVDPSTYRVFNRHLADGLLNPDDRDNPHVKFNQMTRVLERLYIYDQPYGFRLVFWPGPQNVQLAGLFGYTDPDPDCQAGVTPDTVKRIIMMMIARELVLLSDPDGRFDAQMGFRTSDQRTRDQSLTLDRSDLRRPGAGVFTGDPRIDDLIALYLAPPFVGGV